MRFTGPALLDHKGNKYEDRASGVPLRASKLPLTLGNRAGMNTRIYSNGLWTDGATQYAAVVGRAAITTPATPTVTVLDTETAGSGVALTLTRGSTPNEEVPVVAVIAVAGATAASTVTPPSGDGWELKGFALNAANIGVWVFEKVFTTFKGTVGPWTFARSDTTLAAEGALLAFPGAAASSFAWDPVAAGTGTGTSVTVPVVTTVAANSLLVSVVASNAANSVTTDAAYTERSDVGAATPSLSVATVGQAAVAASTAAAHTLAASAAYAAVQFALSPLAAEDRPFLTRRALPDGAWDTAVDLSLVASNTLAASVDLDEHNVLAVARGPDGRVYVAGNMHSEPGADPALRMIRTTATDGSISGTWEAVTITNMNGSLTYPQMIRVTNGDLLLFGRHTASGASSGQLRYARLTSDGTWAAAVTLIDGVSVVKNPYWHPITQHPGDHDQIAMFFAWRVSGADNGPLCYFESLDGGVTWKKTDGTTLTLPVVHPTELTSATRNAETVDAAVDILNQDGACVSTTGVRHAVYKKNNAGSAKRLFHAYRNGAGAWVTRELPPWTVDWQRGHLFPAPAGRVFAVGNGFGQGMKNEVNLLEVTEDVTSFDAAPLVAWDLGNGECPIDLRDALVNGRLSLLVTASETMFGPEYQDDQQWNLQPGYVLNVAGDRVWEIQRDLHRPLGVEVIGSMRTQDTIRVTGARPAVANVGGRLELDQTWAGADLMVRARVRGSTTSDKGAMLVSVIERVDPSTDAERGRVTFIGTTEDGHETPWVPLTATGEGYVQLQASMQPTAPAVASGLLAGDAGFGRITAATIEVGRVRF